MIQIVDQSSDAFDAAEKNMRAIRMQTNIMFGKSCHVSDDARFPPGEPPQLTLRLQIQTILMCLQDAQIAKKDLLGSMARFQEDMEKCAALAQDNEAQFDALVKCAGEVNLAMADEIGSPSPSHVVFQQASHSRAGP